MINICFYFQVHQPFRLRSDYNFFKIGKENTYENDSYNKGILDKVADNCYIPANRLMKELIEKHDGKFKIAFSISGMAIEQFERYRPDVLESFKELVDTGCVELLNETWYHSLAFLYSKKEFRRQVEMHRKKMKEIFDYDTTSFRNTELIYNNDLAEEIEELGFEAILTEGANQILGWRTPNFVYQPTPSYKLKLLLRNFHLSDDLAFRFSDQGWVEYPVTIPKYLSWIKRIAGNGEIVNLFMDYETFGEHQWKETGIFDFLKELPDAILAEKDMGFQTPTEIAANHQPMAKVDVPYSISWADVERDLTAWQGNDMQDSAIETLYEMEEAVLASKDKDLIESWRRLQTSDHFYYMCTKWFSDGDVHKYFNPYASPHDAYILYTNVLNDILERLKRKKLDLKTT